MLESKGHEVIPSASRLIKSLRDLGYDFSQAVADVIDNSIEARATEVDVEVKIDGENSWVQIADNGKGMKPEELREAMRYGADREYNEDDLGRFGLGLKTASMSQCRSLTVASRYSLGRADIHAYCWDLDHIERADKWEILPVGRDGLGTSIREPLKHSTGTVVLWQRLDRVLGAEKRLLQMCRDLETHLAMVFHRFLTGEVPGKKLTIRLKGNVIKPWDPFCKAEPKTQRMQVLKLPLEHQGTSGVVVFEPFVLPPQDDFTSQEAFRAASGPNQWNQQQGFYVYRAGRMIQSGGWSHLRAPDEHTKLARIALLFEPSLDEAFKINVAKMRVQIPSEIRDRIRKAIEPVVRLAQEAYRKKPAKPSSQPSAHATTSGSPATDASHASSGGGASDGAKTSPEGLEVMTFDQWTSRVLAVASLSERAVIEAVVARVRRSAESRHP